MTQNKTALTGKTVLFTGKMASGKRREISAWVEQAGGRSVNHVSRSLDYLVIGMLGWPVLADGRISKNLEKAEQYIKKGCGIKTLSETGFLELLGRQQAPTMQSATMDLQQAAGILDLDVQQLQRWEQFGLVRFSNNKVSFQDLVSLRNIAQLLLQGVGIETIAKTLLAIQALLPDLDRPLAQARLLQAADNGLLVELQGQKMNTQGQLLLDFESEADSNYASNTQHTHALVQRQQTHDNGATGGAATDIKALADQQRQNNEFPEAVHSYRQALDQNPDDPLCWYNLAHCLDELGELDQAVEALNQATRLDNNFPDAVFNLARCYERLHQHQQAVPHWNRYLELDPNSQWSKIARRFLHYVKA